MTGEATSSIGTLTIQGTTYEIPTADDLTLGECEEIKNISGYGVEAFYNAVFNIEGPALRAFAQIVLARAGKRFTVEGLRELKLSELKFESAEPEEDENPDPTPAVPEGNGKPAPDGSPTSSKSARGSDRTPAADGTQPTATIST
jgi:hypothetical protein